MSETELNEEQLKRLRTPSQAAEGGPQGGRKQRLNWPEFRRAAVEAISANQLPPNIELPSLPQAVTDFLVKAASPDFDIRVLAEIVEKDAALTLDLLRHVNSAMFGSTKPIASVREAILRLGITTTRNHLLATGVRSATMALRLKVLNHRNFWNESLQRAIFARTLAAQMQLDPGFAFIGGLLQDYILPVLTNHFEKEYLEFLSMDAESRQDLKVWEQETFGWDHAEVGCYFAATWNFPDELLCAINCHHLLPGLMNQTDAESLQLIPVAMSALLPDQLRQSKLGLQALVRIDRASSSFRLDEILSTVVEQHQMLADGACQTTAALCEQVEATRRSM